MDVLVLTIPRWRVEDSSAEIQTEMEGLPTSPILSKRRQAYLVKRVYELVTTVDEAGSQDAVYMGYGIQVVTMRSGQITDIITFRMPTLFKQFPLADMVTIDHLVLPSKMPSD